MYSIITTSQVVKEIRGDRPPIDTRVVLTRVPRQENQEAFDQKMKVRLSLEVPRLYYLFADGQLATEEYLAMNSSDPKAKLVLSDYVELFASLNPEDAADYVASRLTSFREGLTLRKESDSRRVIQELLTLFPRKEVYLDAARYYRLVKEPDEAIRNYLHYLKVSPSNKETIVEFAEVCVTAPIATVIEHRVAVVRHLSTLGPAQMDAQTLSLFCTLATTPEERQLVVAAIEGDPAKLTAQPYRATLFRALTELQQWEKIAAGATDVDLTDVVVQRIVARAYAKLHAPEKALQILHKLSVRDPSDALPVVEILYDLRADVDKATLRKISREIRHLDSYLTHFGTAVVDHPTFSRRDDREFRSWFRDLVTESKTG